VRTLVQRACRLAPRDYATLAESVSFAVGVELALRLLPFSRVLRWSERAHRGGRRRGGPSGPPAHARLARFVAAAYRFLPFPPTCLRESLVLCALLNRRGMAARLCLGVNKDRPALAAHAWVECEGVASEASHSSFRELRGLAN